MQPIKGSLTTGQIRMDKGFEYYTFEVAMTGFQAMAEASEPLHVLAGWYMLVPRPSSSEIVGIEETKLNLPEKRVVITLKIMRGHYILAEFLQQHWECENLQQVSKFFNEIGLICGRCNKVVHVYEASIPRHNIRARSGEGPSFEKLEDAQPA